jgi:2Fe-2S ferredoxin
MNKKWTVGSLIPGMETVREMTAQAMKERKMDKTEAVVSVVEVRQGGVSCQVPVKSGVILLDGVLEQGCDIKYKCRKGTCGACTVDVLSGSGHLSARNEAEQKKLGQSAKRLACQAVMK